MNMEHRGGTERVTSIIANGLFEKGYEVSVISCQHGEQSYFGLNEHVHLVSLHGEKVENSILRKWNTFQSLRAYVKMANVDILIAVDVALYIYLFPIQMAGQCKCIAWEHFNYYICQSKLVGVSRSLAARFADCVLVLGENDLENYKKNCSKIKRIEYIYNPNALDLSKNSDLTQKKIVAMGRLETQKGFDLLVDVWSELEREFPEWKLSIFGEGSKHEELQKQIDQNGLKNISLCGYANNVEQELLKASIFVFSSRYEGFGLVLAEALARGIPCISFDCKEGPAEIIDDGVNGFLVPELDVDEMAHKLKLLMEDESLRLLFSKSCKKDLYRFEADAVLDKWDALLKNI